MKISWLFASVCLGLGAANAAHANLLINGSFEDTTNFSGVFQDTDDLDVGSTAMPGWTVADAYYVSWIGPSNPFNLTASPAGGDYFLDLTGYITGGPFSGVTQTFATTPGAQYLLTFQLGSSAQWGLHDGLTASVAGVSQTFTDTNTGIQNNLWETESLAFTASGASTTLSLIGASGVKYIGLDDVNVVETSGPPGVPEPGTWTLMLLGAGAAGASLRSARRRAAIPV